jgi:hypothetical protein
MYKRLYSLANDSKRLITGYLNLLKVNLYH